MSDKVLIANRGEIAVRIIRACRELGLPTVAVFSTADKDSLHVRLADESVCIGGPSARESYLNMNNVISAAIATGATMIHPGYGFLSENAQFAEIVESCHITFIGPSHQAIRTIGDKIVAKKIARSVHVPVIQGSDGAVETLEEGLAIAKTIGFPVMLKASNGGGGRGISIILSSNEFKPIFERTALEAETNFGNRRLYVEKYIESPRHIEIQILADKRGNVVHLGERDCSLQRRNQKMVEESPSVIMTPVLRQRMGQAAIRIAQKVKYENAGTVEFLLDDKSNFYFIEMNARIQVEHPVTEMVTGLDLVKEQIRIAQGKPLPIRQPQIRFAGHAIECRINAEDPDNNFQPSPGRIETLILPGGVDVRVDTHVHAGYVVPPNYDSLLAKLVVFAPTREEAIDKMRVALDQFIIEGIKTNIEFLNLIMQHPTFISGQYDTGFFARLLESAK